MSGSDERFVERWSRRKSAVREASEPAKPAAEPPAPPTSAEQAPPPDLPEIETLDADSDYTVFMQDGVPEEVRKLALRALWRSDPVLANLDGLNDYDEDFAAILNAGAEAMRKLADAIDPDAPEDEDLASDGAEERDAAAATESDGAETDDEEPDDEKTDSSGEEKIT